MRKIAYTICLDKRFQKKAKATHLRGFSCSGKTSKIMCYDGRQVTIMAKNKKEHEKLKVAFQVSCRYVDKWRHYFRLAREKELQKRVKETPISFRSGSTLENSCKKFLDLDYTVLLFIHRASDFLNMYSEVSVVNVLFALELQMNRTYEKIQKKDSTLPKSYDLKTYSKICHLYRKGKLTNDDMWFLLALNKLRNELAHVRWNKIKTAHVESCDKKSVPNTKTLVNILGLNKKHFIVKSRGMLRLTHPASKLITNKVIDAILILQNAPS